MRILITGITGQLGHEVARKLSNDHTIFGMVRKKEFLFDFPCHILHGDITEKDWGLDWMALNLDKTIHCAADVNVRKSIQDLRPVNVQSLQTLVAMACEGVAIDYFSSLSVFASSRIPRDGRLCEPDVTLKNIENLQYLTGYAQSKKEAEIFLNKNLYGASKVRIFRPSLIVGGKADDLFHIFHNALKKIAVKPSVIPNEEVNYLSIEETFLQYSEIEESSGFSIFHICNKNNTTLTEMCHNIKEDNEKFFANLKKLSPIEKVLIRNAFIKPKKEKWHAFDIFHSTGLRYV